MAFNQVFDLSIIIFFQLTCFSFTCIANQCRKKLVMTFSASEFQFSSKYSALAAIICTLFSWNRTCSDIKKKFIRNIKSMSMWHCLKKVKHFYFHLFCIFFLGKIKHNFPRLLINLSDLALLLQCSEWFFIVIPIVNIETNIINNDNSFTHIVVLRQCR